MRAAGVSGFGGDYLDFGVDLVAEHALDRLQDAGHGEGAGAGAGAAGAGVAHQHAVVLVGEHVQVAAVALQVGAHAAVEHLLDALHLRRLVVAHVAHRPAAGGIGQLEAGIVLLDVVGQHLPITLIRSSDPPGPALEFLRRYWSYLGVPDGPRSHHTPCLHVAHHSTVNRTAVSSSATGGLCDRQRCTGSSYQTELETRPTAADREASLHHGICLISSTRGL